jgi:tetratricopeptide (TPR) repeat protein
VVIGGEWLCRRVIQLPIAGKVAILGYCIVVTVLTVLTIRRNEDYQSVESMWRSVLAVYPGNDEALNNLAVGLEAAQKFEEAIEVFKQCPDDAPAMATYGILLCRQDRPKEGLYYMRAALGNIEQEYGAPEKRAGKHYDLGKVLFILDDRKSAEHHFARAIAIAPLRPQSYFAMGVLMNQQGRHDEAAKFFAQGLKLDEKNPDSRTRSARYFLHNYPQPSAWTRKEALFFARQAAQSTSYKDLQSLEILVEALAANGKFTEAADVVRQALQSLPAADYERFRAASHRMLAFHQREAAANKK